MDEKNQSVVGHLTELRQRLVRVVLLLLLLTVIAFQFSEHLILDMIEKAPSGMTFVYIEPQELFMSYMVAALIAGFSITLPFLLYNIWAFAKPGLLLQERRAGIIILTFGTLLFALGVIFSYWVIVPITTSFFYGFTLPNVQPMISFRRYLSYILSTSIAFGVIFEMPILIVTIIRVGLISAQKLRALRKYILLIIVILAAVLTPPDVVSQMLLALPMLLLFEVGVFIGDKLAQKK